MKSLYIGSTTAYAGKSLFSFGLGKKIQKEGYRLGYFKPLGANPSKVDDVVVDDDAVFIANALGLDEPLNLISPVVIDRKFSDWAMKLPEGDLMGKVVEAHGILSRDKDFIIIGGAGNLLEGKAIGLDGPAVVSTLDARALVILSCQDRRALDTAIAAREWMGERFIGVVLNRVPQSKWKFAGEELAPYLEKKGLRVLGMLPTDSVLESVSVGELARHLGGELIVGQDRTDLLVERMVVGAMNLESALKILRRAKNKAVITGGDRADIQLASLETSTRCLILTGGHYPNEVILAKAEDAAVPVMVVRHDTFTTVEKVEKTMGKLHPHEWEKLNKAAGMIESNFDFKRLTKMLE